MLDEAGLATAEWLERTAGPWAALPVYTKVIPSVLSGLFTGRAVVGALRCAVKLGNEKEVEALAERYTLVIDGGEHLADIIMLCKMLVSGARRSAAVILARAEAEREPRARAYYLLGRCLELTGDSKRAFDACGHAASLADKEKNAADVALAARAKRVEQMLGDQSTASLAYADAAAADPTGAPAEHKLVIALGRLRSPSRFVRASGLSLLEEIARDPTTSLGRMAIRLAVEHADAIGDALTAVEADRVGAAIRHVPDEAARNAALSRLVSMIKIAAAKGDARADAIASAADVAPEIASLVRRARAFVSSDQAVQASHAASSPDVATTPQLRLAALGLDAVVALQNNRTQTAADAMQEAAKLFLSDHVVAIPPSIWTAIRFGFDTSNRSVRDAAAVLAEVLINVTIVAPPMGFSGLARGFEAAGRRDLALRACSAAIAAKEDGANEFYGGILRDEGWAHAARGEREAAINKLREARDQLVVATASTDKGR